MYSSLSSVPLVISGWLDSSYSIYRDYSSTDIFTRNNMSAFSTNKPSSSLSFIPPKYGNIGKNVKDLFKKKYDFTHSLKTIHSSPGGVTFESGILSDAAPFRGYIRAKEITSQYELEAEANTDPTADTKATVRIPRLYPGLLLTGTANNNNKGTKYTADVEYVHEGFTTTATFNTDLTNHNAKVAVTAGMDGVTIGGILHTDLTNGAEVTDYNLGLEYIQSNYVASLYTEDHADTATLAYYHKLSSTHAVGAALTVDIGGNKTGTLQIGNDYILDNNTAIKAKVEVPVGLVTTAIEHRLKNPQVLVSVAASYLPLNFNKAVKAEKFGVGVTFGDY